MHKIFKCKRCNLYTLQKICPICKSKTYSPLPPRFKQEDKWSSYRRRYKIEMEHKGREESKAS